MPPPPLSTTICCALRYGRVKEFFRANDVVGSSLMKASPRFPLAGAGDEPRIVDAFQLDSSGCRFKNDGVRSVKSRGREPASETGAHCAALYGHPNDVGCARAKQATGILTMSGLVTRAKCQNARIAVALADADFDRDGAPAGSVESHKPFRERRLTDVRSATADHHDRRHAATAEKARLSSNKASPARFRFGSEPRGLGRPRRPARLARGWTPQPLRRPRMLR